MEFRSQLIQLAKRRTHMAVLLLPYPYIPWHGHAKSQCFKTVALQTKSATSNFPSFQRVPHFQTKLNINLFWVPKEPKISSNQTWRAEKTHQFRMAVQPPWRSLEFRRGCGIPLKLPPIRPIPWIPYEIAITTKLGVSQVIGVLVIIHFYRIFPYKPIHMGVAPVMVKPPMKNPINVIPSHTKSMPSFMNHLLHCIRGLFKALLVVEGWIPRWKPCKTRGKASKTHGKMPQKWKFIVRNLETHILR